MKKAFALFGVVAGNVLFLCGVGGPNAYGQEYGVLPDDVRERITDHLAQGGIPEHDRVRILTKLDRGELPDSLAGREPQSVIVEGSRRSEIFPDGSRRIIAIGDERAGAGGVSAFDASMQGCIPQNGWNVGCRVSVWDVVSEASFTVDYHTSYEGAAEVRDVRAAGCKNVAGPCTVNAAVRRAVQDGESPAWASLSYTASAAWVSVAGEFGVQTRDDGVWTYHN